MTDQVKAALQRRLGDAARAQKLADAFDAGLLAWGGEVTTGKGAVPTTLVSERVDLLLQVSMAAKALLTEREIAALLRVTPGTAKRLSNELRAVYEDTIQPYVYEYAFDGATKGAAGKQGGVIGVRVEFASEEQLDAFLTEAKRTGVTTTRIRGEADKPWLAHIADGFDLTAYGL